MATRRRTGSINQGAPEVQIEAFRNRLSGSQGRQKVDELVEIIRGLVDREGYFEPEDVHKQVRNTDLAKSASIIMSNLRLQGFGKDDRLRVPAAEHPDGIKKLINLASRLRKKGLMVPYDEAVAMILAEPWDMLDVARSRTEAQTWPAPEPQATPTPHAKPVPATVSTPPQKSVSKAAALQSSEPDYRALYDESRDKTIQLEAELEAYRQMCFRLIDTLRK
jgi:hypothetical protein